MAKEAKVKKTKKVPTKVETTEIIFDTEYAEALSQIKKNIQEAQIKAVAGVNRELNLLYWTIGRIIIERQERSGWGNKVIEKLGNDIQKAFPGRGGFSRTNISWMRAFYLAYANCPTAVGQLQKELPEQLSRLPWGHNIVLFEKLKNTDERLWYAQKALEHGWSRSILEMQIEQDLFKRQGKAITNFKNTLPPRQSDMAQQQMKDPYIFDFLTIGDEVREKETEDQIMNHLQKFLLELGQGFSFVGRQFPLKAGRKNLYIDLLFYHLKLRCYVVIELKAREFDSRDAGQMSAYLSAVDDQLRHKDDMPTLGMILCKTKDNIYVEYILRNFNRPIGVAGYETTITEALPKEFKGSLPTVEEIEAELSSDA